MSRGAGIFLCIMLATVLSTGIGNAQTKAVGSTHSFAGIGLSYERYIDDKSFADLQLRLETATMFTHISDNPGISASFTWNTIFADTESESGNIVRFYAGPGIALGMSDNLNGTKGVFFGLKGRVGGECTFPRKVTLSVSVSPVIGAHIGKENGMTNMLLYKYGLLYSVMPEIGIKYAF